MSNTLVRTTDWKGYRSLTDDQKTRYNQFKFIANLRLAIWMKPLEEEGC
jgi:hypothetical protein